MPSDRRSTASVSVAPGPAYRIAFSARLCATTRSIRGRSQLDLGVAFDLELHPRPARLLPELVEHLVEHRPHELGSEPDDSRPRLELAQKEHLVDELGDLARPLHCLLEQLGHVLTGQSGRLEQCQKARERGPKLVRNGSRESRAQLLVRRQVALAREVDETLPPSVDLVGDDERDDSHPPGQELLRKWMLPL